MLILEMTSGDPPLLVRAGIRRLADFTASLNTSDSARKLGLLAFYPLPTELPLNETVILVPRFSY